MIPIQLYLTLLIAHTVILCVLLRHLTNREFITLKGVFIQAFTYFSPNKTPEPNLTIRPGHCINSLSLPNNIDFSQLNYNSCHSCPSWPINCLYQFLARSFFRIQGLGRIQNAGVQVYCEALNIGRKRRSREKKPLKKSKAKANPFKAKLFRQKQGFFPTALVSGPKINCTKFMFLLTTNPFAL